MSSPTHELPTMTNTADRNPFGKPAQDLRILRRVLLTSASLASHRTLTIICEEIARALMADAATLIRAAPFNPGSLEVAAEHRPIDNLSSAIGLTLLLKDSELLREVMQTKQSVAVFDVQGHRGLTLEHRQLLTNLKVKSSLIAPLTSGSEVIGAISIDSQSPRFFSETDQSLLQNILNTLAPALEQMKLLEQRQALQYRFQDLLTGINGIVWEAIWNNKTLECSYISPQVKPILGYSQSDFIGNTMTAAWVKIAHPDERKRIAERFSNAAHPTDSTHLAFKATRADSKEIWLSDSFALHRDQSNQLYLRGVMIDISNAHEHLSQSIEDHTLYDPITGLPNPVIYRMQLESAMRRAARFGHHVGLLRISFSNPIDRDHHLVRAIGETLQKEVRNTDLVARTTNNEFSVILADLTEPNAMIAIAQNLNYAIHRLALPPQLRTTIGAAIFPKDADTPEGMYDAAHKVFQV
jgi:diguanylate cyclase (GGDEF)-like protein/PAS domain S-box-containing protein